MNDNYLKHHGVKGMKWGVRRRRDALNAYTGARRSSTAKTGVGRRVEANEAYKKSMKESSKANVEIMKNVARKTSKVSSQIAKDTAGAAKTKYNNMSDKGKRRLKIATRVGLALTPVGITGQLAAHGAKKYADKHPEKIQAGKDKVNRMKDVSVSSIKKYADLYKNG